MFCEGVGNFVKVGVGHFTSDSATLRISNQNISFALR